MKHLGNLSPNKGSNVKKKRLGRGLGSGLGKTAGKGYKGQTARKGGKVRPGFEGGQTPLYRRLPKRGFTNIYAVDFNVVNVDTLGKRFQAGATVNKDSLNKLGLLTSTRLPIKVLGRGTLAVSLTVNVDKCSESAKAAIEKAGGKVTLAEVKTTNLKERKAEGKAKAK